MPFAYAIAAMMIAVACFNSINVEAEPSQVETEVRCDLPVSVYTEEPSIENETAFEIADSIKDLTVHIESVDSLSTITDPETIVVIDGHTVNDRDDAADDILNLTSQGNLVIVVDSTPELFTINKDRYQFTAFSEESQISCMGTAPDGGIVCNSICGYSTDAEAMEQAYIWAAGLSEMDTFEIDGGVGPSEYYTYNHMCEPFGKICGTTIISQIEDYDDGANYYVVHYQHEGIVTSGDTKDSMNVRSDLGKYPGQVIYDHYPRNEARSGTVTFNVSRSFSDIKSLICPDFGVSWSHTYSEMTITDRTDLGLQVFEAFYDLAQGSVTADNNLIVEPGLVLRTDASDGAYHASDTYSAQFCNVVIDNVWYNDFRSYSHTADFTVYPNNGGIVVGGEDC